MKETGSKRKIRSFIAGTLAFLLMVTTALSGFPPIQAQAAAGKIWHRVETGSGNGNGHVYSDALTNPAAVLLHLNKIEWESTFNVTYEKQGDAPNKARLGFFYSYLNDSNWLYVGSNPDGSWYYEYNLGGSTGYPSLEGLPAITDTSRAEISVSVAREALTVTVNGVKVQVANKDVFEGLKEAIGNEGRPGFRAGKNGTEHTFFRFTDAKTKGALLSDDGWSFLAACEGQVHNQETIPVYSVTGAVKDGNTPVENAVVRVGEESVRTAADGSFSLSVEQGTYVVSVSASGYRAYSQENVEINADKDLGEIVLTKKDAVNYEYFISNGTIKAAVSNEFPQVFQYELTLGEDGAKKIFAGQENKLTEMRIGAYNPAYGEDKSVPQVNLKDIEPTLKSFEKEEDHAVYVMNLKDAEAQIDFDMTVKISVSENDLIWEVTNITKNSGCVKINTIDVPELNLVTITYLQVDTQFMGAVISGDTNAIGDREITFEDGFVANNSGGYAYGFLSADGISAGVWSNSEMVSDNRLVRNNGVDSMSLTSAAWYYDYNNDATFSYTDYTDATKNKTLTFSDYDSVAGVAGGVPISELPCAKVCFAADENEDSVVDWQDGAIAYRDIMNNPYGSENTKDLVNYRISMNFNSQATNPYLKTADNIKKVYLATDGLPQAVMMKGYGSEGHDSANSEYGYIADRLGGLEELKQLNTIAHNYNVQMGIHINAQECYPEAQTFSNDLVNGVNSRGWGWLDQSYNINRAYDLGSGLRYKRLLQLYDQLNDTSLYANKWPGVAGQGEDETVADAETIARTVAEKKKTTTENLDFMYLDVWYGASWETRKIAQQFNSLGWRFSTEFGDEGEYDSTWQHWATEGHYGGSAKKGLNSDVIRFIRNHQKDSFVLNYPSYGGTADNPLLGGFDLGGFEGWGGSNDSFNDYIIKTFLVNLPTKFLQHYKVYKWENYENGGSPVGNHEKEITLVNDDKTEKVVVTRNEDQITSVSGNQSLDYVERTIKLNGKKVLDNATYLLPWTDWETDEEKLYHFNYEGGATTWELQDSWKNLGSVTVYALTDVGRTAKKTVPVTNGSITLDADAKMPYIVVKDETSEKKEIKEPWSEHAHVVDSGFNNYSGVNVDLGEEGPECPECKKEDKTTKTKYNYYMGSKFVCPVCKYEMGADAADKFKYEEQGNHLDKEIWSGDINDVKVVRIGSTGNKYLQMGSETETQSVSTTISDLEPGTDYVAQVYVENKSDAKAWIKVTGGSEDVSNYTLRSLAENYVQCDAHSRRAVSGSRMQIMQVPFTADSSTATLTLEREAGEDITYFDDIRIVDKKINNIQADGSFKQDFESVVSGMYPFVLGPAQGVTDHVTHLSELHAPYTQSGWGGKESLDDVLEGKWSLKHHGNNTGIIYRTIPQNLHFEAGQTYNISFDYQSGQRGQYYIVIGEGDEVIQTLDYMENTAENPLGGPSETKTYEFRMVGADSGQSWFGLASAAASLSKDENDNIKAYGLVDFVLDNLEVKKVGVKISASASTVTSAKDPITLTAEFSDELDESNLVTWTSSDENVVKVVPDPKDSKICHAYFVGFGNATITMRTMVGVQEIELPWAVSFPEIFELPSEEQKKAEWVGVYANTESATDNDTKDKAIDGESGTQWHSQWTSPAFVVSEANPAILTVKIADGDNISNYNRVTIQQRTGNVNGLVKKYKCVVGDEFDETTHTVSGNVYTTDVITAKKTGQGEREVCVLPAGTAGKYLQIQVLEGEGTFASIAELELDKAGTNNTDEEQGYFEDNGSSWSDKITEALEATLANADAVNDAGKGDYSEESWAVFEAALNAAKNPPADATPQQLLELQQDLVLAISNLTVSLDKAKTEFNEAFKRAEDTYDAGQGNYTDASWESFKKVYEDVGVIKDSQDPKVLVKGRQMLEKALEGLKEKTQEQIEFEQAQQELKQSMDSASKKISEGQGNYTTTSWKKLVKAYEDAKEGKNSEDKETLKALTKALDDAMKGLAEKSDDLIEAEEALAKTIESAGEKIEAGQGEYTNASWKAFQDAYNAALKGNESDDKAEVQKLDNALKKAMAGLITNAQQAENDKAAAIQSAKNALQNEINASKTKYSAGAKKYTSATWTPFKKAYDAAVAGKNSTDVNKLKKLRTDLYNARIKLKIQPPASSSGTGSTQTKKLSKSDYTDVKDIRYTVIDPEKCTVEAAGLKKNMKKANILSTVEVKGIECKVTQIKANGFKKYTKLTTVTIGANVEKIGKAAFSGCKSITKLTIGANVKSIDAQSFSGCKKIKNIVIKSKKLTSIGKKAFKGVTAKAKVKLPKLKGSAAKKLKQKLIKAGVNKKAKIK